MGNECKNGLLALFGSGIIIAALVLASSAEKDYEDADLVINYNATHKYAVVGVIMNESEDSTLRRIVMNGKELDFSTPISILPENISGIEYKIEGKEKNKINMRVYSDLQKILPSGGFIQISGVEKAKTENTIGIWKDNATIDEVLVLEYDKEEGG